MEQHDLIQGSAEWHQHRATHFNASDAPAMMGCSPYKTRTQLLDEMATGIAPEIDEATQRRFDDGHRFEELARPVAEKIVGKKLYRVTGSVGELSASFDGLTADDSIAFEHKSLNADLCAVLTQDGATDGYLLPLYYRIQMEQQCLVSGCLRVIFMASKWNEYDQLVEERHCWYYPDLELRGQIIAGWGQFKKDLTTHQPKVIFERPQAQIAIELPALFVHAHGAITDSNMEEFGRALTAKLEEVRAIKLETDQDFSNAKEAAKLFRDQAKKLKTAKEAMLAQTVSIGEASRMMDTWAEDLNKTALQLEKDVEREDLAKKRAMCNEAALAFSAHIEALEAETRPIQLGLPRPDFAAAIKSKRSYTSMHDAIQTLLAQCKSQADAVARDYLAKLAWFSEYAKDYRALFADLQQIITKPEDDFQLLVQTRINQHKQAEAERMEQERQRIEAEAKAKAEREAAEKLAQEEARIRAEERAKAEEEAKAKAATQAQQHDVIGALMPQPAMPQPIEPAIAPVVPLRTEEVLDKQDVISAFLRSRDFGKDESRIRAVLVEFVKFDGGFKKAAA